MGFNEFLSLKKVFYGSIEKDENSCYNELKSILRFPMFRGKFEDEIFQTKFNAKNNYEILEGKLENILEKSQSYEEENNEIIKVIKERYKNLDLFKGLKIDKKHEDTIKSIKEWLEKKWDKNNKKENYKHVIIIISKIRNNYFHGIKEISYIIPQNTNFNLINNLLYNFISHSL